MCTPGTHRVLGALEDVRFVGGCVRDAMLGRLPADIDLATPLPPESVVERLEAAHCRTIPTGIRHGTVTALCQGMRFEITTLRRDVACDGRHAVVAFTDDWRADAARRDFTINALSCLPDGRLFDYFGGVADLEAGRVRFVGAAEQRIREDVLRLLRFFRFHARYARTPADAEALAACRSLAPLLPTLSGERVQAELFRILTGPRPEETVRAMADAGVLGVLLPEALEPGRFDALIGLEAERELSGEDRAVPRLAGLLKPGRAGALAVAERLRLSRAARNRLVALAEPAAPLEPGCDAKALCRAAVTLADDRLFQDLALLAAAGAAGVRPADWLERVGEVARRHGATPFPLTGADLLDAGVPAGPGIGKLLGDLRLWWADAGFAPTRAECLEHATRALAN